MAKFQVIVMGHFGRSAKELAHKPRGVVAGVRPIPESGKLGLALKPVQGKDAMKLPVAVPQ